MKRTLRRGAGAAILFAATLALAVPMMAEALTPAAEAEAQAIRETAGAIRQIAEQARGLSLQIEAILRESERPGAEVRGAVPGWERSLANLRSEAARLRAGRAALRTEAVNAERADREAVSGLRTFHDLDRRLQRLDEEIGDAARALQNLQARLREPEIPRAEDHPAPPRAPGTAAEAPGDSRDLSGTWLRGREEWSITHDARDGAITIRNPHREGASGEGYDEYVGRVTGGAIVATHRVGATSDLSAKMPPKVRAEVAGRGMVWTLRLTAGPGGQKLEGTHEHQTISYNAKTLKIVKVTPKTAKITLARRSDLASSTVEEADEKEPATKGSPEPGEDLAELARLAAEASARARQFLAAATESSRRVDAARRRLEAATARLREARQQEEAARPDEGLLRRLERELEDARGMEQHLRHRQDEEMRRLQPRVDDERRRTGASEEQAVEALRRAGAMRDYDSIYDDLWRNGFQQSGLLDRIRGLEGQARGARIERADAERKVAIAEADVQATEAFDEVHWYNYKSAHGDAVRAREAAATAARRSRETARP